MALIYKQDAPQTLCFPLLRLPISLTASVQMANEETGMHRIKFPSLHLTTVRDNNGNQSAMGQKNKEFERDFFYK